MSGVHFGSAPLANFAVNSGRAIKHAIPNMIEAPRTLQGNSLIVASLVLAASRIMVSNFSALKAKGTPESRHRYDEAIGTTVREVGGWTLSFAVLRQLQKMLGWGVRKVYKLEVYESAPPTLMQNIKTAWKNRHTDKKISKWEDKYTKPEYIRTIGQAENIVDEKNHWLTRQTVKLLRKLPGQGEKDAAYLMKKFHAFAPIGVGSLVTIYLAGHILEGFTRDHKNQVVNAVSRMFKPNANQQPPMVNCMPAPAQNGFGSLPAMQGQPFQPSASAPAAS